MYKDKGAHFHRCDLQVHSPRDSDWQGNRPTGEGERREFADLFIRTCRERGINAVAITDHHDVAFFPYIKFAAENELDDNGDSIPVENRLTVFPGMELTLGVPCQALLILDADFSIDLLPSIPTILSIITNPKSKAVQAPIERLTHIKTLSQLCELLDRTDYLRGHYIILPHVKDKGHGTILRSGFAGKYKDMPCVGGYVDGSVDQLGEGARTILEGRNRDYGFKALGVFQTSDCRQDDLSVLGKYSSWVKWSLPIAEALRQACLARETRISNQEPLLPSIIMQFLEVSNSKFMGPINLDFNPQLNCLIGGRGTGKSTILEYLRWGLCDQPPRLAGDEEVPDFEAKRASLINNTLYPLEGVVTVGFLLNLVPHVVRRNARTGQILLKIDDGEFQECDEKDIQRLLPIQCYSQKQLSAVGVRQDELNRLVQAPVEKQLTDLYNKEDDLKAKLRILYGRITSKRSLEKDLERARLELHSLSQQVLTFRKQLKGLSREDQSTIAKHELIQEEERLVGICDHGVNRLREIIELTKKDASLLTKPPYVSKDLPNKDRINKLTGSYESMIRIVDKTLSSLVDSLSESGDLWINYRDIRV